MRFLHTADLHIGKTLNDVLLLEDQRYILEEIARIAEEKKVDAVLIAGDVYQRSAPQAEAMTLFSDFVKKLKDLGCRVYIICGNHDSEQRIAYFSELIRSAGVYVSDCFDGTVQQVTEKDEYGEIVITLLPFLRPLQVKKQIPQAKVTSYQDAVQAALNTVPVDKSKRNIILCHQFISGAVRSDSEEKAVGGLENIDAALLNDYDYAALGHIHGPQQMTRETIRYAGSPLKYSMSEVDHKKSVVILDMKEKGNIEMAKVELKPLRDMRCVEGMSEDILNMPPSDDYVWVTVHDEVVPPDMKISIRTSVFPNMLRFTVENSKTRQTDEIPPEQNIEGKDAMELFIDFFRDRNNGVEPDELQRQVVKEAMEKLEGERHEAN